MPKPEQALQERTKSLAYSGGIWSGRVVEKQRDLVRQLSLHAIGVDVETNLLAAGRHLAEGGPQLWGGSSWSFKEGDVKFASPGRWGYITQAISDTLYDFRLNLSGMVGDEVVANTTGEPLPFVQQNGLITILAPGAVSSDTPVDGFAASPDLPYYSGSMNIGCRVLADLLLSVDTEDEGEEFLLAGGAYVLLDHPFSTSVFRSREAAWFLRTAPGCVFLALETAIGDLMEGTAFHQVDGWLILRHDPHLLWPDGIAHATAVMRAPDGPKHFALKTDRAQTAGRWVANYKRQSQSPGAFIRALAEVAGLPVFEEDDQVCGVDPAAGGFRYHTATGRAFVLPGAQIYTPGALLTAGDFPREILDIRCQGLQGVDWWEGRTWNSTGIDISFFRPGFTGIAVNNTLAFAESYSDTDGALRGRIRFNQDFDEEERYWVWQAVIERRLGVETFAKDILGFSAPGDSTWVRPLALYARALGPWFWVVESSLPRYHSGIWKEVLDFIAREKPSGAIVAGVAI